MRCQTNKKTLVPWVFLHINAGQNNFVEGGISQKNTPVLPSKNNIKISLSNGSKRLPRLFVCFWPYGQFLIT